MNNNLSLSLKLGVDNFQEIMVMYALFNKENKRSVAKTLYRVLPELAADVLAESIPKLDFGSEEKILACGLLGEKVSLMSTKEIDESIKKSNIMQPNDSNFFDGKCLAAFWGNYNPMPTAVRDLADDQIVTAIPAGVKAPNITNGQKPPLPEAKTIIKHGTIGLAGQ